LAVASGKAAVPVGNFVLWQRSRSGRCCRPMRDIYSLLWRALLGLFRSRALLQVVVRTLRQQLNVLQRKAPTRPTFQSVDRFIFSVLYQVAPSVLDALTIVRWETVIRWHRAGFRAWWRWKSRPRGGRPKIPIEIRRLIRDVGLANPLWGAPRIHANCSSSASMSGTITKPRFIWRARRDSNS
jgi:hypothetical protein